MLHRLQRLIETLGLLWTILGWFGLSAAILSLGATIGGVVWAMTTGIAAPVVMMAAFCTLTAGAYFTLLPMAFRALQRAQAAPVRVRPDPEIWRHVLRIQLYQAACLLADIEPDYQAVDKPGDANGWFTALCDALKADELLYIRSVYDKTHDFEDGYHPHRETVITRESLQNFAKKRHVHRAFLD